MLSERWFQEDTGVTFATLIADGLWLFDVTVSDGLASAQWITLVACEEVSVNFALDVWSCDQSLDDRVRITAL